MGKYIVLGFDTDLILRRVGAIPARNRDHAVKLLEPQKVEEWTRTSSIKPWPFYNPTAVYDRHTMCVLTPGEAHKIVQLGKTAARHEFVAIGIDGDKLLYRACHIKAASRAAAVDATADSKEWDFSVSVLIMLPKETAKIARVL